MNVTIDQLHALELRLKDVMTYVPFLIAGGAVRDAVLGRDVKDVDILIGMGGREGDYTDYDAERSIARKISKAINGGAGVYEMTSESGYAAMADEEQVYATYEVEHPTLPKLNLIFVQHVEDALNEFPDTLSQVYLEDGKAVTSAEFDGVREGLDGSGQKVAVLTYLEPGNKRLVRLSEKYPEAEWLLLNYRGDFGQVRDVYQWA